MGSSSTSSRLRKVAKALTGPGVTTWRLVRMMPRSASTTKPVACDDVFHSVSKARAMSIWIATTPVEMRSSVRVQREDSSSSSGCGSGITGICGGVIAGSFAGGCGVGCCWRLLGLLRRRGRRRQGLRLRHFLRVRERRREDEDGGCDCEPRGLALSPAGSRMFHEIDP